MNVLQRYLDHLCGKALQEVTIKNYYEHAKKFCKIVNKPIQSLTQEDINKYIKHYQRNAKHNGNCCRFYAVRRFLDFANMTDLQLPKMKLIDSDKIALNQEQIEQVMETVELMSALHRIIFYLEHDGIRRPKEIRNIKIADRNDDILWYDGKEKPYHIILSDRLIEAWEDYIAFERPTPKTPHDAQYLILTNCNGLIGTHLKTNVMLTRIIKEVVMESGVRVPHGEAPTNYLIKRTSISRQLKECPDPKIIQLQAGHSDIKSTMRYNRVTDEDIRGYVKELGKSLITKKVIGKSKRESLIKDKIDGVFPQTLNKALENEDSNEFSFSFSLFEQLNLGVVS